MLSFSSTPNSQSTITQAFSLENNFSAYQGDSLDFYNTDFQSDEKKDACIAKGR
jgi:hypothetical protein